ncbi:MAG: enoyl-CoA hydratase/isomerase family protein [bacterium]|nr:enoyl-CoA hydratase/isomerase family protein [bacterium]
MPPTDADALDTIEFAVVDHVATVTLDRSERLNAFNRAMADEMSVVWNRVRDDDAIHVAIIQANGERAFCTGIDVKEGKWWGDWNVWNQEDPGRSLGPKHHRVWKPVIAAVHGMCAGGGMYFVNEADIVVCSDDATFFDPHADGHAVSALEPIGMLKRGVPLGEVMRWALMGTEERITAKTAQEIGLVSEVVSAAELRPRVSDIASQIAARNPIAVQGTVRAIWEAVDMTRHMAIQNGMSYTHIGNPTEYTSIMRQRSQSPRFR